MARLAASVSSCTFIIMRIAAPLDVLPRPYPAHPGSREFRCDRPTSFRRHCGVLRGAKAACPGWRHKKPAQPFRDVGELLQTSSGGREK
jgi:hypothetical protein